MGSRALLLLRGASTSPPTHHIVFNNKRIGNSTSQLLHRQRKLSSTKATTTNGPSSLPPPDVSRLTETARISLTPQEVEEFAPKISQVINWFGQLQDVDLNSVEPAIRADTEGGNLRDDIPETFDNRKELIAAIPSYEEPYIKVPKVLNKE